MDEALRFYRDGLGLEQIFDRLLDADYLRAVLDLEFDRIRAVYLQIPGGGIVELLEYQGIERMPAASRPCDYGAGHLCLYVDDIAGMTARRDCRGPKVLNGRTTATGSPKDAE